MSNASTKLSNHVTIEEQERMGMSTFGNELIAVIHQIWHWRGHLEGAGHEGQHDDCPDCERMRQIGRVLLALYALQDSEAKL